MLVSTLITQLRREFGDNPKTTRKTRNGDGTSTVFNVGDFPIIESTIKIYLNNVLQSAASYEADLDTGDIVFSVAPGSGVEVKIDYEYAHWRDQNWMESIGNAIEELNGRGFFKQIVRNNSLMSISANVQSYNCPTACIDLYEVLESSTTTVSGTFSRLGTNFSYQQDANKLVLGSKPTTSRPLSISYLRRMQSPTVTSATVDVKDDWINLIKKYCGSEFHRYMAGKIAKQGNASVDEGHFSFTGLRAQANDLFTAFDISARRAKPTRPAKYLDWYDSNGGQA